MDVLLTFVGYRDPYVTTESGGTVREGPILDLVSRRNFDHVVLFSTEGTSSQCNSLQDKLTGRDLESTQIPLEISDPTDYLSILKTLRDHLPEVLSTHQGASVYVSVASGTPQMHASWVMLVAGGELPARILHTRPPQHVTPEKPAVAELDVQQPEFPEVRAPVRARYVSATFPDVEEAVREIGIVGDHPAVRKAVEVVAAVSPQTSVPVLILGETGTGKELFARLAHRLSGRPSDRFVPVNCASIPEELAESTLFGHEKGAFTGASERRTGLFDRADGGTLFLDEVGELPLQMQSKLLRVLEGGIITPVGAEASHSVNTRIIAATNRDIKEQIESGKFREDLYYRLNMAEIRLPPLRKRRSDIPRLALHFLDLSNEEFGKDARLSSEALLHLQQAELPGNVRDLKNIVGRAVLLADDEVIEPQDLDAVAAQAETGHTAIPELHEAFDLKVYLDEIRQQLYGKALEQASGNKSKAARMLGVTPPAVDRYLEKHGANKPE
jgi:DNA-binding NtrC family response regulator